MCVRACVCVVMSARVMFLLNSENLRHPRDLYVHLSFLFFRLMNKNPLLRPSATEILQDPFIKSHLQVCVCVCVCVYMYTYVLLTHFAI